MNRSDLIRELSDELDIPEGLADQAVSSILNNMTDALARGEGVYLRNFGRWTPRRLSPAQGVNPKTGQEWEVDERMTVRFTPGKALKDRVARGVTWRP